MKDRREELLKAIQRCGFAFEAMELFANAGEPTLEMCHRYLDQSDLYVGVIGHSYGSYPPGMDQSYTELEYEYAKKLGIDRLVFVVSSSVAIDRERDFDRDDPWEKQKKRDAFLKKIRADQNAPERGRGRTGENPYTDPVNLSQVVMQTLSEWLKNRGAEFQREPEVASDPTASGAKAAARGSFPALLKQHLTKARADYGAHRLIGFPTGAGSTETRNVQLHLKDLYVSLFARNLSNEALSRREPLKPRSDAGAAATFGDDHRLPLLDAFRLGGADNPCRGIVIVGDPGTGKTTHLRKLAHWLSTDGGKKLGLDPGCVPLFVPLRDLHKDEMSQPAQSSQALDGAILRELERIGAPCDRSYLAALRAARPILYLLDGLDEVPSLASRARVSRWIESLLHSEANARIVVTCRVFGYQDSSVRLGAGFTQLELLALSEAEIEAFVDHWYSEVERCFHKDPARASAEAQVGAQALKARLKEKDFRSARLSALAANPLLLTLLCLVFRGNQRRLPTGRAALYLDCIRLLVETWRKIPGAPLDVTADEAMGILQPLAFELHSEEQRTHGSAGELEHVLREPLKGSKALRSMSPEGFLQHIRDECGVLTGVGPDRFGFIHLGLQEFLTAREMRQRVLNERIRKGASPTLRKLVSEFGNSWWQEVQLLFLALDSSGEAPLFELFFEELLKSPGWNESRELLTLCLEDATKPSVEPLREFVERETRRLKKPMPSLKARRAKAKYTSKSVTVVADLDPALAALDLIRRLEPETATLLKARLDAALFQSAKAELHSLTAVVGALQASLEPKTGMRLVRIPAGSFWMGSKPEEWERQGSESPIHRVTLTRDYWLGATQVTNQQYERYLEANPEAPKPEFWTNRRFNQPEQPVVGVSWEEAMAFCNWLGNGATLPTEAQWERACRGIHESPLPFGFSVNAKLLEQAGEELKKHLESTLQQFAWFRTNSGGVTHPVGEKEANGFGLFDMHGNVWEWCSDRFGAYSASEQVDPIGGRAGAGRVLRGGSYGNFADWCRSAFRNWVLPSVRDDSVGFRVCFPAAPAG